MRAGLIAAALAAPFTITQSVRAGGVTFASTEAAVEQGLNAYRGGYLEIALPALRYAADKGSFLGRFLLATILADNNSVHTDHPTAYRLFREISTLASTIDPDDDPRAPYVARALIETAGYLRRGLPEIHLAVDAPRATQLLYSAASFFGDPDAQLELAKMLLTGEGGRKDPDLALHFLSTLSREGHPGALALFAELHWRGKHVPKDGVRALALAAMAVKRAASTDRIWIDEIYQSIYCSAGESQRRAAQPKVERWDRSFGAIESGLRSHQPNEWSALVPTRTCANGEVVPLLAQMREHRTPQTVTLPGERPHHGRPAAAAPLPAGVIGVDAKR